MKTLMTVLGELGEYPVRLGGSLSADTREALATHRRRFLVLFLSLYFIVLVTVIIAIVAAGVGLRNGEGLEIFSGVMVLVVGSAMEFLRRCVREWSDSTLLIIILDGSTEAETRRLIRKLVSSRFRR